MVEEARLVETESGLEPEEQGWFVVNVRDAAWWKHRGVFGFGCPFGGRNEALFPDLGIVLRVLQPGEPNCRYHAESQQEDFLVLSGECLVLLDGQERRLKAWDFVHCPGGTEHVFVGAGDGPCVMLMVGARSREGTILYPRDETVLRHRAGVEQDTEQPSVAYSPFGHWRLGRPDSWGDLPWAR